MIKLQFSNEGFTILQTKLNSLTVETLKAESESAQHDVTRWITKNFETDQKLAAFLSQLCGTRKNRLALELSFAIENRILLSLIDFHLSTSPESKSALVVSSKSNLHGFFYCDKGEKLMINLS